LKEVRAVPKTPKSASFDRWIKTSSVVPYVLQRQNEDGGYTFAQWSESSAQDTYFAIQILKMLGVKPPRIQSTIKFLRGLQQPDGSFDSTKVAYYVIKSLNELGTTTERSVNEFILRAQSSVLGLGSFEVNIEASSEIETTYLVLEILKLLGETRESEMLPRLILNLRNHDGSFGKGGYSSMASVYFAAASLKLLGYDVNSLKSTLDWIRACENPAGGFARSPKDFDAYLILDEIYYGLKALQVLDEVTLYPSKSLKLIGRFQNGNGGFRRSIFLGISTFESTYYALSSLESLTTQAKKQSSLIG
jgi:hypothetical protein